MRYERPASIDEAIDMLATHPGARPLAGGTDLLVQIKLGRGRPERVVDLKHIPGLCGVEATSEGFRIGAATPAAMLGEHAGLRAAWPGVVEAAELIGSTQIQHRASLGGNICNASPAADSVPALIAANAFCSIAGPKGERRIAIGEVATGPGTTSLASGEFLVDIRLPAPGPGSGDAYLRIIPRSEMDIAIAGAGVALTLDESGRCTACRVAIGAVAPTALLVPDAADALVGHALDTDVLETLAARASAAASPIDDVRGSASYRRRVVGVLARRAATLAAQRAGRPA